MIDNRSQKRFNQKKKNYAGSYPEPPNGLHRNIRFTPLNTPTKGPYLFMASIIYALQVGVYRHLLNMYGDNITLYMRTKKIKKADTYFTIIKFVRLAKLSILQQLFFHILYAEYV